MQILDDVTFGGLADGHDGISRLAGVALFNAVGYAVEEFVIVGVAPDNEVMNGDHSFDGMGNTVRQLVTEAVENVHIVGLQMHGQTIAAPKVREMTVKTRWLASRDIGIAGKIVTIFTRPVGRIKNRTYLLVLMRQSTYKHTAVVA